MEEFKNGIISEEALDEIAGGAGISKDKLIEGLKIGGIFIGSASAVACALVGSYALGRKKGYNEGYNKGYNEGNDDDYVEGMGL